jgi:hypothetical protein
MKRISVEVLFLVLDATVELFKGLVEAMATDSPGGKRVTMAEFLSIIERVKLKLKTHIV